MLNFKLPPSAFAARKSSAPSSDLQVYVEAKDKDAEAVAGNFSHKISTHDRAARIRFWTKLMSNDGVSAKKASLGVIRSLWHEETKKFDERMPIALQAKSLISAPDIFGRRHGRGVDLRPLEDQYQIAVGLTRRLSGRRFYHSGKQLHQRIEYIPFGTQWPTNAFAVERLLNHYKLIITNRLPTVYENVLNSLEKQLDAIDLEPQQRQRWHELWRQRMAPQYQTLNAEYQRLIEQQLDDNAAESTSDHLEKIRDAIDALDAQDPLIRHSNRHYQRFQIALKELESSVTGMVSNL